jgi:protein-disulfide isomerase
MKLIIKTILLLLSTIFTTNFILISNLYSEENYSKEELDNYIYEYIMNNPEVILKSVDKFRQKTEDNAKVDDEYIKENFIKFANNPNIPYMGSDKPKVIIIEFFDYNCGYCKKSLDAVTELLRTEFDLKISFRDYPILAPSSRTAAKAALASREQGKYFIFHSALMNMQGNLNEDKIFSIATNLGMNLDKLKEDMDKVEIDNIIKDNETLARKLNIRGTPTFIINGELYAGALELNKLKTIIDKALNDS